MIGQSPGPAITKGGIMSNSKTEAREIVDAFMRRRGHTVNAMREELRDMLKTGHGDDLFLYANELKGQFEAIMQHVRGVPAMVVKDGLSLDDITGGKVRQ